MRIYVPSLGRHSATEINSGPLVDFHENDVARTVYVVRPDELDAYHETLSQTGWTAKGVSVLPCSASGIAETRQFVGYYARESGEKTFAMCDDDVRFVVRKSQEVTNLVPIPKHSAAAMWSYVEKCLEHFAHVGVSARQGNNRIGVGGPGEAVDFCTRTLRVLCYQTEQFLKAEHNRVEVMEDFDVNLQLLRMGKPNLNLGYWSQDQKMTNAPGGCSLYRDHARHEASARRLAELHPKYVTLRQKQNKTGGEFGSRTEVTIFWKKAYEDASSKSRSS